MNILTMMIEPDGVWRKTIFFCLIFISILLFKKLPKEISLGARLFWFFTACYSLLIFEYPGYFYGSLDEAFQTTAAQVFAEVLLIPLATIFYSDLLWELLPFTIIYQIACVWMNKNGFFVSPSFNTAFIALSLPFLPIYLTLIGVITIFVHHGSTALLIFAAEAFAFFFVYKRLRRYLWWGFMLVPIFYFKHDFMWGADSRIEAWKRFMHAWAFKEDTHLYNVKNILVGAGPGSFMWLSMIIDKFKTPIFLMMHCDFLQIIFELGFVGFFLCLWTVGSAVLRVKGNPKLLGAVLGCCIFALTYHPLRWAPSEVLVCLIFREVFFGSEKMFFGKGATWMFWRGLRSRFLA